MAFYKILASELGADTGPFVIKSNSGAILATGVTRLQLLAGYTFNVPLGVTAVTITNAATNTTCATNQTFPVPNVGLWEMEKATVETISDHYGTITAAFTAPVDGFVSKDIVGIQAGVVSGTGAWTIKGGPEDIAGTVYNGGGTLITTAANTNTITNIESGAILQVGLSTDGLTGSLGGTTTNAVGGTVNIVGANEPATPRNAFSTLVNQGTMNVTGPDRCGEGYIRGAVLNNQSTVTVDKALFRPNDYGTGTGIIHINDGATLEQTTLTMPATQTIQLNGCGKCNEFGKPSGALLYGQPAVIASPIVLQSEVCMKTQALGNTTFSGSITGNFKLKLGNVAGNTTTTGSASFTGTSTFTNTVEVTNTSLYNTGANTFSQANIVLVDNGKVQQDAGALAFKSLSSASSTSTVLLNGSASLTLKNNGNTTYAGTLGNSTPGTPWPLTVDGPATNQLKLTNPNGAPAVYLYSKDGSKIIAQGGQYAMWQSTNGGNISAGTAQPTRIDTLYLRANDALDVYASGTGVGLIYNPNASYYTAGWKVNVMDALPAGTYNIIQKGNSVALPLPVIGTNASGRTATFANVGNYIQMTLA